MQETLERSATDAQLNDIKALLGRMMFTGKAVHKKVRLHIHFHTCWPAVFRHRSMSTHSPQPKEVRVMFSGHCTALHEFMLT